MHLGGLDALEKLQVLSVGNNLLSQLDNVMYLRNFAHLQALNLIGNPFCQEEEYRRYAISSGLHCTVPHLVDLHRRYVLAHLKHIKYLDYRLVDQQAVGQAKEQYQDEVRALPFLIWSVRTCRRWQWSGDPEFTG